MQKIARISAAFRMIDEASAPVVVRYGGNEKLIEQLRMTESEAHYYIERQAMDMRLSRREVAENIIRSYDQ